MPRDTPWDGFCSRIGDTKTPRPVDGASVGDATFASDRSYRGEARECERRNGEDAHERVEARAGRSHTNLQSGNPADSGGGRSRNPSPVALRPRVTPGLPFSADPSRAGTALAVCHDPTPSGVRVCTFQPVPSRGRTLERADPMGPVRRGSHSRATRREMGRDEPRSDGHEGRATAAEAAARRASGRIPRRERASRAACQRAMRPASGRRGRRLT